MADRFTLFGSTERLIRRFTGTSRSALARTAALRGVAALPILICSCGGADGPPHERSTSARQAVRRDSAVLLPGDTARTAETDTTSGTAPLAVVLVPEGDVLNARSGAGAGNSVVLELSPHATGLIPTGKAAMSGGHRWLEVQLPDGRPGWVNAHFTTEHVSSAEFCDDPRISPLLTKFDAAVQARDGRALAALTSPHHGLVLRRHWWNPEVRYTRNGVDSIFTAGAPRDWGVADGTGFPINGSFKDVALPLFDRLYAGKVTRHCNDVENGTGSSAGYRIWPFEYANINYYALYRAAAPGDEFNWNTWAVGVEYVDRQPYVAFLVHYQWEI